MLCCGEDEFGTGKKWMGRVINFADSGIETSLFWFESESNLHVLEKKKWEE